jgi:hypothetical protein
MFELWQSDVVNDVKDDVAGNLRRGIRRKGGDDLLKPINGNKKRRRRTAIPIDKVEAGVQKSTAIEKF